MELPPQPIVASVVVLAYGPEPTLERCIQALKASTIAAIEIIVVDNGAESVVIKAIKQHPDIIVIGPPVNRGFAGGCNVGVEAATGDVIVLINSDAFVSPEAVSKLVAAATAEGVGMASAAVTLDDEPELINSAGNPVHFSGLCWAGAYREPLASLSPEMKNVPTASGAALAIRRQLWCELGGFDPAYFAYAEDTELSIRCWQRGYHVVLVPSAVVRHQYEFSRNNLKFYLLERNRLLCVLTTYQLKSLVLLAPALFAVEVAMIAQAVMGGWGGAKLSGYFWLMRNAGHVYRRRLQIQRLRRRSDRELSWLYCGRIEPANIKMPQGMKFFNTVLAAYWKQVSRLL